MQSASIQYTGLLIRLIGIDELIGETELRTEIEGGLFLGQERVRPGFRHKLANPVRDDLPSPGRSGFENRTADGQGRPLPPSLAAKTQWPGRKCLRPQSRLCVV